MTSSQQLVDTVFALSSGSGLTRSTHVPILCYSTTENERPRHLHRVGPHRLRQSAVTNLFTKLNSLITCSDLPTVNQNNENRDQAMTLKANRV